MIYFENINIVIGFIHKELVDADKSVNINEWVVLKQPTKIYLKHSSKEFHSNDEIIEELKRMELLHEITEFQGVYFTEPKSHGFILHYSRIKKLLSGKPEFIENDVLYEKPMTINQACEFLSISRPTLYRLIEKREINSIEILGKKRIQLLELINYISKNKNKK
jgi:excisionase family DNA binding protein